MSEVGAIAAQAASLLPSALPNPYLDAKSLPYRFRKARFVHIAALIDTVLADKGEARILDIGGTEQYWDIAREYLSKRRVSIELVNLHAVPARSSRFIASVGDATDLADFPDDAYDIVHSNSVIEHVGGWPRMKAMARNVRRLAPRYFVQTPNFWFPIEPHFRAPFFHWLPAQLRYRLIMRTSLGFRGRANCVDGAMASIEGASLIDRPQMQALFPDAEIRCERFGLMTKSLMAVKG